MQSKVLFLVLVTGCLTLMRCSIEQAKPAKDQCLIIASDCLWQKDTALFQSLKKIHGIRIFIHHLPTDRLKEKLISEGLNTKIDAVVLSSVYQAVQFSKAHLFQKIRQTDGGTFEEFLSDDRQYSGIGYDPYVIIHKVDSILKPMEYEDLAKKDKWCSDLALHRDMLPFFATIIGQNKEGSKFKGDQWIYAFLDNQIKKNQIGDSLNSCKMIFTKHAHVGQLEKELDRSWKERRIIFPNQQKSGAYADMPVYAIIRQSRNYMNALVFLNYIFQESVNKRINFALHTYPLLKTRKSGYSYQNEAINIQALKAVHCVKEYPRIDSMLNKKRTKKSSSPVDTLN